MVDWETRDLGSIVDGMRRAAERLKPIIRLNLYTGTVGYNNRISLSLFHSLANLASV